MRNAFGAFGTTRTIVLARNGTSLKPLIGCGSPFQKPETV